MTMTKKHILPKPKAASIHANPYALKKLKISLGIIVGAFAFLLYAQSISFNYTYDDHSVTYQNNYVKMGISSIPTLMKTDYFYGFKKGARGPIYRPASLIMFATEWNFFP